MCSQNHERIRRKKTPLFRDVEEMEKLWSKHKITKPFGSVFIISICFSLCAYLFFSFFFRRIRERLKKLTILLIRTEKEKSV